MGQYNSGERKINTEPLVSSIPLFDVRDVGILLKVKDNVELL